MTPKLIALVILSGMMTGCAWAADHILDTTKMVYISTSPGKIEAVYGDKRVEITRRMVCDAWGHKWILDDAENAREMTYAVMRYHPAPVHYICAVCEKKKYRQTINSTKEVVEP